MSDPTPTVFIVDDDDSVRGSLARLMRIVGYHVVSSDSAEAFLALPPFDGIGCLVLDIRMPGRSGLELQEALARTGSRLPIIFITGHGDIPMGVSAMKKGAADFLTKPFDQKNLLAAIGTALDKSRAACRRQSDTAETRRRIASLTPRERDVLSRVVGGLMNKQIAAELSITEQTVKMHRGRMMRKMAVASVADLVRVSTGIID
jgi:FixJ family two-component response regulator